MYTAHMYALCAVYFRWGAESGGLSNVSVEWDNDSEARRLVCEKDSLHLASLQGVHGGRSQTACITDGSGTTIHCEPCLMPVPTE